eukprot:9472530-Pyramimonas_sp.AAC.1
MGAIACPAPLIRGFPGQKQASPKFLKASRDTNGGVYGSPSGGESHHECREQVESLARVLANFLHPLSRGAIKKYWS